MWEQHSGGTGHAGPEWSVGDDEIAETFYATLRGKAKIVFDLFINHPGQPLTVADIVTMSGQVLKNQHAIAGALNGLRLAHEASGRRYPFYWWEGSPSRYAVKPSVAELFVAARERVGA